MKSFALVVFAFLAAASVKGDKEMMMKMVGDCKAKTGAGDDAIAKLMSHSPPTSDTEKCLFACIIGSMKIVVDGKLDKPGMIEMAKLMTAGDPAKMALAEEIFDECSKVTGSNECDTATNIGLCLHEQGKKRQIIIGL